MCGISGILKFDPRDSVDEARLKAMSDSLVHRGPDGSGLYVNGRIGLAHRRLSIIDLEGGHQPMKNEAGTLCITYNGELYNFRKLRARLEDAGYRFKTDSDTEVVLKLYEVMGENCLHHLEGMYAFAIWDAPRQKLFLVRDRMGIKPLYYYIDNKSLVFASEIKAILEAGICQPVFNKAILPQFLAHRYVAEEETFFKGIRKLMPGCTLTWNPAHGFVRKKYWKLPQVHEKSGKSFNDYAGEVRTGLEKAVQSHLVSDVPVGLFLSGGLDSTAIAALMKPALNGPLETFSVGFEEKAANEFDYARLAASVVGSNHHEVLVSPEQYFAELPGLIWHEDEPIAFTSSIPLNIVSRLAREHVKVVLTGEGADELFLGYDYRYRITAMNLKWGAWFERLLPAGLRHSMSRSVPGLPKSLKRYAERSFLALECDPRAMFFENFSVFRSAQRQSILRDPDLECVRGAHELCLDHFYDGGSEALDCMSRADLQTYLVELLMKQDQMSMAASLESRVPYLDHRLVEQVSSIPARYRMWGGQPKALLREAVKDIVPTAILNRGKMGFPVPIGSWLRGPFWGMVEEFVLGPRAMSRRYFNDEVLNRLAHDHRTGKADHAERLWLLINLEIWQRIFIEGESPELIHAGKQRPLASMDRLEQPLPAVSMRS